MLNNLIKGKFEEPPFTVPSPLNIFNDKCTENALVPIEKILLLQGKLDGIVVVVFKEEGSNNNVV